MKQDKAERIARHLVRHEMGDRRVTVAGVLVFEAHGSMAVHNAWYRASEIRGAIVAELTRGYRGKP